MKFLRKLFDHEYKELTKFQKIATQIDALDEIVSKYTDEQLKNKTQEFKERLQNGETLEDIKVEAFAVVREAAYRVIGEKPYFVQMVGGLALHYGNIAEMKTGEGKTLTSTMPAYLNALSGEGVHIITVNDYLAGRDAENMGRIHNFLGLTVGLNKAGLSPSEKREAYHADITYSTNNELGFDYLRDNMVVKAESRTQRGLNFVIIDEVDSILVDEARTPLIISGGVMNSANLYLQADRFAKKLKENEGYIYDEKTKSVSLDTKGIEQAEKEFSVKNLFDIEHTTLVHYINNALKANYGQKKDVDYVVQEGQIVLVDQNTGRLMVGRQYSDGVHQAIEAKEGVKIGEETKTLATITFQNLFRLYKKISGMTGTAKTEEEEFREIYNMYVIEIPTNKPITRVDYGDLIFSTQAAKYKAIVSEIKERYENGQPVLVGTISVETSELVSKMLSKEKVPHEVLNAKNHAREAEIIAKAGHRGSVTIATNMAGRGTDIKLTEEVRELGGLCVLGTERHESRRIDNQLRGRAGRQGDPGFTQFCVSFEDELMIRFGTDRAKNMLQSIGFSGDLSLRSKMFSNMIESAQKRVEGNNFDTRKTLLQYDDVINQQRKIIYERRNEILDEESIHEVALESIDSYIYDLVMGHVSEEGTLEELDYSEINEVLNERVLKNKLTIEEVSGHSPEQLVEYLSKKAIEEYKDKILTLPKGIVNEFEKAISLRVIDTHWMDHINTMAHLKEGIGLRAYAQEDPLRSYTNEGFTLFEDLQNKIDKDIAQYLVNAEVRHNLERNQVAEGTAVTNDAAPTGKAAKAEKRKAGIKYKI